MQEEGTLVGRATLSGATGTPPAFCSPSIPHKHKEGEGETPRDAENDPESEALSSEEHLN